MQRLILVAFVLGTFVGVVGSQDTPIARKAPVVLDLLRGKVLGAKLGMNEAAVRSALEASHITDIEKVSYPHVFLLQSKTNPGMIFNFDSNGELNDIYINNPRIVLANGLKLGQPIQDFDAGFGQPVSKRRLPSEVGVEFVYAINDLELGVIVLDEKPDIAKAVTLRKPVPSQPRAK